jgi:type IV secretory pathway VirB3-like protein
MEQRVRIHQSLLRSPLFWGVPRELLALEIATILTVVLIFGMTRASLVMASVSILPVHALVRFLCARDADGLAVLVEALSYRGHYPAAGTLLPAREIRVRRSLRR